MKLMLAMAQAIDAFNERAGKLTHWLILVAVLISAGNAVTRYSLDMSSNAWLEVQWYLFSAVFLFCAGYTLLHNQHVRIDIVSGRFSRRVQTWIEFFGTVFFLSWPVFVDAWRSNEVSTNAGGLAVWPARLMLPIGFLLLVLQGFSELIKRIAFLRGLIPDPADKDPGPSAEELLAEALRRQREEGS